MSDKIIFGRSELDGEDLDMDGSQDPAIYAMKRLECIYSKRLMEDQKQIEYLISQEATGERAVSVATAEKPNLEDKVQSLIVECDKHSANEIRQEAKIKSLKKRLNSTCLEYEKIISDLKNQIAKMAKEAK